MESTGVASQCIPSAARVAYALAISSGVVSDTPRVNAPQPLAFSGDAMSRSTSVCQVRPSFSAMRTARSAPILCSSCTKYVFTDMPKPDHIACTPVIAGLALRGHHRPPQDPGPSAAYCVMIRCGELILVLSGSPISSAATIVKILNVDPAW